MTGIGRTEVFRLRSISCDLYSSITVAHHSTSNGHPANFDSFLFENDRDGGGNLPSEIAKHDILVRWDRKVIGHRKLTSIETLTVLEFDLHSYSSYFGMHLHRAPPGRDVEVINICS